MQTSQQNNFSSDLDAILEILSKSPFVLTSIGFSSDPFVLMKQIFLSSKSSKTAAILLDSSRDLFKKYGNYAQTYFKMLKYVFSKVGTIQDSLELRNHLEDLISATRYEIEPGNLREDYKEVDELVLSAIEKADGSFLSVEKGLSTKIEVKDAEFTFTSDIRSTLHLSDLSVLVFQKEDQDFIVRSIKQTLKPGKPLVIITTFESSFLASLAKENFRNGIYFFNARATYLSSDFYQDLIAFVNQTPVQTKTFTDSTAGHAISLSAEDGKVKLSSKHSIQRSFRIKHLIEEIDSEKSVNRRLFLQKRLMNLVYLKTVLFVSANSEKEQDILIAQYASQIKEISNCIISGRVKTNPISQEFNGLSSNCFAECLTKASQDILLCKDSKILEIND